MASEDKTSKDTIYKLDDVSKHTSQDDLWVVIHKKVYNVTKYLEDHPGGAAAFAEVAGQDATPTFEDVGHSADARETMAEFLIGKMDGGDEDDEEVEVKPKDLPLLVRLAQQQSQKPEDSSSVRMKQALLKLMWSGSGIFLAYEMASRMPYLGWLHSQHGGFWRGFLIASVAGISAVTLAVVYTVHSLGGGQHTLSSWPAHYKPKTIAKPINQPVGFLKPQEYQKLTLVKKDKLSKDSHRLVFKLPKDDSILGLPIGQHISIRAEIDGKQVTRSYTPVSNNSDPGELRLVIKNYADGQLTGKYISNLKEGDEVEFRGPKGAMRYRRGLADDIGMVAGGTGITPMYQLIRAICEDPRDKTRVKLLYGSNTEEDILLKKQLDDFQEQYPENFQVTYVLSKPGDNWKGRKGYIDKDLAKEKFAKPETKCMVLLCGPPPLVDGMKKSLVELGYDKPSAVSKLGDQVFSF